MRLIRLTELGDGYWNGAYARERLLKWKGAVMAQTTRVSHINNGATGVYTPNSADPSKRLTYYSSASGPQVDKR